MAEGGPQHPTCLLISLYMHIVTEPQFNIISKSIMIRGGCEGAIETQKERKESSVWWRLVE